MHWRASRQWHPAPGTVEDSMAKQSLIREFFAFIRHEKKWWMIPLVLVVLLLGIVAFVGSTPLAPFAYPLF